MQDRKAHFERYAKCVFRRLTLCAPTTATHTMKSIIANIFLLQSLIQQVSRSVALH